VDDLSLGERLLARIVLEAEPTKRWPRTSSRPPLRRRASGSSTNWAVPSFYAERHVLDRHALGEVGVRAPAAPSCSRWEHRGMISTFALRAAS